MQQQSTIARERGVATPTAVEATSGMEIGSAPESARGQDFGPLPGAATSESIDMMLAMNTQGAGQQPDQSPGGPAPAINPKKIELGEFPFGPNTTKEQREEWLKAAGPQFREGLIEVYHTRRALPTAPLGRIYTDLADGRLNGLSQRQIRQYLTAALGEKNFQAGKAFLDEASDIMRTGSEAVRLTRTADNTRPQEAAFRKLENLATRINQRIEQNSPRGRQRNGGNDGDFFE